MKNFFDNELSVSELKNGLKKLRNGHQTNVTAIVLTVIGVIIASALVALAILRYTNRYAEYESFDCYCDDEDCDDCFDDDDFDE